MSKIHVISPGRNPGPFLLNCIDSVERQTLQPNSHIIVDDMSDRETVNILKTCEKRNSYIEIIHNKTRNYRLKNIVDHASRQDPEDIICAVDSDDWLARKDALSIIKKTYDDDPKLEYVYSNYRW
jgi:glycosyltransferase involved in cell wall biosynthesis